MLERHHIYVEEKLQEVRFQELRRIANNPCWLERLVSAIATLLWQASVALLRTLSARDKQTADLAQHPSVENQQRSLVGDSR
jgi:hypothetical protein